ncbi:MAG: DUF72 domain-containing protein [Acidobacteriota bacterium]
MNRVPPAAGEGAEDKAGPPPIMVGTAGWAYSDWEGIVYPEGSRSSLDRLAWMARFVDIMEINSTFYRAPRPGDVRSWVDRVKHRPGFRFSAKLERVFTHLSDPPPAGAETRFKKGIEPLAAAGRLAALLVQFPISFKNQPENRRRLARLLARFSEYPLAVEIRDRGWLDSRFMEFLTARGVALAGIDQPQIGASVGPSLPRTASFFYVRLHGRNSANWFRQEAGRDARYDYLYSPRELDPWLGWMKEAAAAGTPGVVIANNHYRGQAAVNAVEIRAALRKRKVKAPAPLIRTFPHLADVAESLPAQALKKQPRLF